MCTENQYTFSTSLYISSTNHCLGGSTDLVYNSYGIIVIALVLANVAGLSFGD